MEKAEKFLGVSLAEEKRDYFDRGEDIAEK